MSQRVCPQCNAMDTPESRNFCAHCGAILDIGQADPATYENEQLKLARIIENLQFTPHSPVLWHDTADLYARSAERLLALLRLPTVSGTCAESERVSVTGLKHDLETLLHSCRYPEFQIAFVGTIKTGKSTLINALLGHNYASMAVTPETAALTKFRSSPKDYVHVTFYDDDEWMELWRSRTSGADAFMQEYERLSAESERDKWVGHEPIHIEVPNADIERVLHTWSSSSSAEHYFVKEIEVGISSLPVNLPKEVVFVDTPGLSDPVAYRSEITRNYIRRANAVFVCVDAGKVYKEEIETIASVFSFSAHNRDKVHIIATHWDTLNNPEKDWEEQKAYLVERLTGKGFFEEAGMARRNIMPSAAHPYNLLRDYTGLTDEQRREVMRFAVQLNLIDPFDPPPDGLRGKLSTLVDKTNIGNIRSTLVEKLAIKYSTLLWADISQKYKRIHFDLTRLAREGRDMEQGFIDATGASLAEMEEQIQKVQADHDAVENYHNQLNAVLRSVQQQTDARLLAVRKLISDIISGTAKRGSKKSAKRRSHAK